jgi:hypothetical protein
MVLQDEDAVLFCENGFVILFELINRYFTPHEENLAYTACTMIGYGLNVDGTLIPFSQNKTASSS